MAYDVMGTFTLYFKGSTNDGYGYPSAITGYIGGDPIILPTHTPARTGYTFVKWTTNKDGTGTTYYPGDPYGLNTAGDKYLYAQWAIKTYSVSFNANGGTGAPSTQTKTHSVMLTLSTTKPTRTGYNFIGWGTTSTATSVRYSPGGNYGYNSDITLYAIWELVYEDPKIENVVVSRCDSAGAENDDGTYFRISFDWETYNNVTSVTVGWKLMSAESYTTSTISSSGTSASVDTVLGAGGLDTEYNYDILVTVSDDSGSTTYPCVVPSRCFAIDVTADGTGVAFGKPATESNLFDVKWPARFDDSVMINGDSFVRARRCYVRQTRAAVKPWYRYASIDNLGVNEDTRISFKVTRSFSNLTKFGIINVAIRTNNSGTIQYVYLDIESSTGLNPEDFVLMYGTNSADLWVNLNVDYDCCYFEVLSESTRLEHKEKQWVLYNIASQGYADDVTEGYTKVVAKLSGALNNYPVGSMVIRYDHQSPANLYGGTWTRVAPYFLYGTSAQGGIGDTGYVVTDSSASSRATYIKISVWRRVS